MWLVTFGTFFPSQNAMKNVDKDSQSRIFFDFVDNLEALRRIVKRVSLTNLSNSVEIGSGRFDLCHHMKKKHKVLDILTKNEAPSEK